MNRTIALVAVLVLSLSACSDDGDDVAAPTSTSTTVEKAATTSSTRSPAAVVNAATTTPETLEAKKVRLAAAFDQNRVAIAEAIEEEVGLQSVDRYEFDQGPGTMIMVVTTGYQTEEIVRDKAWEITDVMLDFWREFTDLSPGFQLTADQVSYSCPGDFMRRLADRRATRAEWQASCGS